MQLFIYSYIFFLGLNERRSLLRPDIYAKCKSYDQKRSLALKIVWNDARKFTNLQVFYLIFFLLGRKLSLLRRLPVPLTGSGVRRWFWRPGLARTTPENPDRRAA